MKITHVGLVRVPPHPDLVLQQDPHINREFSEEYYRRCEARVREKILWAMWCDAWRQIASRINGT